MAHLYCMQQGVLKVLTVEETQNLYAKECLREAERALDEAQFNILLAGTLIQESHRYDK